MSHVYDTLEVAKLAAFTSSQLRKIDNETSSSVPANRIDINTFKQNVIQAANPNQYGNGYNPNAGVRNSDEARMLEFLNRQAMAQVPEVTPQLIPQPVQPQIAQPVAQPVAQLVDPNPQSMVATPIQPTVKITESVSFNNDNLSEISNSIKNIDNTLRELADYFLDDFKKKKILKKNQIPMKKQKTVSTLQAMSREQEIKLLKEIKEHQKLSKDVQNNTTS